MRERRVCGDGQMVNRGVQVGYRGVFSHTGRWRARGEEDNLRQYRGDPMGRHRAAREGVMQMQMRMVKGLMATDINRMA